jgi:hypothetical protein
MVINHMFYNCVFAAIIGFAAFVAIECASAQDAAPQHPLVGRKFEPKDVDYAHPVYETSFGNETTLEDWKLEGGKRDPIRTIWFSGLRKRCQPISCWSSLRGQRAARKA